VTNPDEALVANGRPDFETTARPALEAFFAPIRKALEHYALRCNLRLEKYHNSGNGWDFSFRHPSGGTALIQVLQSGDDSVLLVSHWCVDGGHLGGARRRIAEPRSQHVNISCPASALLEQPTSRPSSTVTESLKSAFESR
jgi:hypothetical protein